MTGTLCTLYLALFTKRGMGIGYRIAPTELVTSQCIRRLMTRNLLLLNHHLEILEKNLVLRICTSLDHLYCTLTRTSMSMSTFEFSFLIDS